MPLGIRPRRTYQIKLDYNQVLDSTPPNHLTRSRGHAYIRKPDCIGDSGIIKGPFQIGKWYKPQ